MQTPLDFLNMFRIELRASGIRFAITSGMACVHYGLQQTTKDSCVAAARRYDLPPAPFTAAARATVYEAGLARAAVLANLEPSEIATLAPPIEEMLP